MKPRTWRLILRSVAIAIAIAAVIDPAVTINRAAKPLVAVVAARVRDSSLAVRVARSLDRQFLVVRAPSSAADASVIVGDELPSNVATLAGRVFAVFADRSGPVVTLEQTTAPNVAPSLARVPIATVAHVTGARGRMLDVSLRVNGIEVDHATRGLRSDDERTSIPLSFTPSVPGAALLHMRASVGGSTAVADVGVDVRDKRWPVLVFDPRPSWMSTFVRRALERDPRFAVASRVVTSRNVSTAAGQPPARLDDLASLAPFDAIVVGAPDALSDRDVAGLDAFLRRRGGRVILLLDRRASGPYEQLLGVTSLASDSTGKTETIVRESGADSMRGAELAWPSQLPPAATVIATAQARHAIVWASHVGAGQVIVSGALDAWRFRDPSVSGFDRFWQTLVADAADAAPAPLAVIAAKTVALPGERIDIDATHLDASLSPLRPIRISASASLTAGARRVANVRLWPGDRIGTLRGTMRAPSTPGFYRLAVETNGARGEASIIVAGDASRATPDARGLVRAWAESRGGAALEASALASLPARLVSTIRPADRRMIWHPMRSAWWILPFAFALSLEWWLRRRRGLL